MSEKVVKSANASMDLTEGAIWKQLLLFSLPILLSNLFQQLYNTMDAAMVGALVSSDALAAVGSTGALINLIICLFVGLSTGATVVISRFYGAKDSINVERSVHTSVAISILSGIFLTIVGIILSPLMLTLMKTPPEVIDMSTLYIQIIFGGMIPQMLYNILSGILRAVGDSKRPLYYLVIGGVANIIMNYIFIAFFHLGVAGAALATVASQIIAVVLIAVQLMRTHESFRLDLRKIKINGGILLSIVKIGVPAGIQSMMYSVSNLLIQSNINVFGSNAMAGCAAYSKIDGFLYMPLNAFGLAATTFTGQNMGACKYDRVKKGAITGVMMGVCTSIIGVIIVFFTARYFVSIFTQGNAEAIEYGISFMKIIAPFYWVFSATEVLGGVIRGAGSALSSTIITALNICLLRVLMVSLLMPFVNDIRLVFLAYPVSWIVSSTTFLIYYKFGHWMKKTI